MVLDLSDADFSKKPSVINIHALERSRVTFISQKTKQCGNSVDHGETKENLFLVPFNYSNFK